MNEFRPISPLTHRVMPVFLASGLVFGLVLSLVVICAMASQADAAEPQPGNYAKRADVAAFAADAAKKTGVPLAEIQQWLDDAKYQSSIVEAMNRPAESKTWAQYRPIFITPKRIADGVVFWNKYAADLNAISQKYHVDPAIIVAIVGVETFYGQRICTPRADAL